MMKYILIFVAFSFLYACSNETQNQVDKSKFVSMDGKKFKLHGKDFYPVVLNYVISTRFGYSKIWASPCVGYSDPNPKHEKAWGLSRLKADFQMIKDLGFNTIRLTGIGENYFENGKIVIKGNGIAKDTTVALDEKNINLYYEALNDIFTILDSVGLKAIVLVKNLPDKNDLVTTHLQNLLSHFKNEPAILAWDFFNEPLYFDGPDRKKKDVIDIVKKWKELARTYAPNHLLTIGLTGSREVFEWDPNILDLDFLSIHPYEFRQNEILNEIYWYWKNVKKPWIIGETGFSADGDSISYEVQRQFGLKIMTQVVNCKGNGFSWWQYKDVPWFLFQNNYLGLLNHKGSTQTSNKDLIVNGTPKPIAEEIKKFDFTKKTGECNCTENYFNYENAKKYLIKGKLINSETKQPIPEGGVVAWCENWSSSTLTFTKPDGTFELYADFPFYHFIISATLFETKRTDFVWNKMSKKINDIEVYDIGTWDISPL